MNDKVDFKGLHIYGVLDLDRMVSKNNLQDTEVVDIILERCGDGFRYTRIQIEHYCFLGLNVWAVVLCPHKWFLPGQYTVARCGNFFSKCEAEEYVNDYKKKYAITHSKEELLSIIRQRKPIFQMSDEVILEFASKTPYGYDDSYLSLCQMAFGDGEWLLRIGGKAHVDE